jgi:Indole-3-glycerol phosphate synthase
MAAHRRPPHARPSTIIAVGARRLSQAISEGERISILLEVRDGAGARSAVEQKVEGIVLRGLCDDLAGGGELPVLVYGPSLRDAADAAADAVVVVADAGDDQLDAVVEQATALGLECVVRVADEDDLQRVLERLDPEILLLVAEDVGDDVAPLDRLLELLPDIPAGKLAIAELAGAGADDVAALERAGVDAVLVSDTDIGALVSDDPPEV